MKGMPDYMRDMEQLLTNIYSSIDCTGDAISRNKASFLRAQPKNLCGGTLKQYQLEALNWFIELSSKRLNGILADDMGLGKTIQTISYMAYLSEEHGIQGRHLIVVPKAVMMNWQREFNKWLPHLNVQLLFAT